MLIEERMVWLWRILTRRPRALAGVYCQTHMNVILLCLDKLAIYYLQYVFKIFTHQSIFVLFLTSRLQDKHIFVRGESLPGDLTVNAGAGTQAA